MLKFKLITLLLICAQFIGAQDLQLEDFQAPPNAAKPRVWWHWMNGNITKDGIQKDLEWMKRTGIGGFQNFDANLFTPVVVAEKLVFMTPEWKDAFKFTTETAANNGLEMAIAGSPGWSVTGGPWVEPKDGMKKYVWTETRFSGGRVFSDQLPQPSDATGRFQGVVLDEGGLSGMGRGEQPRFYEDALVIAYRVPESDIAFTDLKPKVSSSGGKFTLSMLTDGDLNTTTHLPPQSVGEDMWIQYEFENPQTFKGFSIVGASHLAMEDFNGGPVNRSLKVSDDGVNFREVTIVPGSIVPQNTVSFNPVTARYFRFAFTTLPPEMNMFAAMVGLPQEEQLPKGVDVAEIVLHNTDRIDQFEDKAGFTPWPEGTKSFTARNADAIDIESVINLSSKMSTNGLLEWEVPDGTWVIVRFGYSLTGRQNHPASPEATGLEVDKLDKEAVQKYINTYLDLYEDATGGKLGPEGLGFMVLDSYEAGHMNWTKNFPDEFEKRRNYGLAKWIPVLTGRVVKSAEASEKFLWDFRKTIGELIVENHYDIIGEELHKRGMKRYTESHENKRIYLADGMDVKRNADIPMSAMWTPGSLAGGIDEEVRSEADIRESASVAHIYGKKIVAGESMTSVGKPFQEHPERLKRTADMELASGLNRFVIHTSVHQPLNDKKPGFSLGPFGQYFTRHETWSGSGAKAWIDYLARSSYLLQQGENIADVLYYYGENQNITWLCREQLPEMPTGYEFDFVNASALLHAIHVEEGKLIAQSGNSYELLVLHESAQHMTLPVLRKLRDLIKAGAKIAGAIPVGSPSLSDDPDVVQALVNEIRSSPNFLGGSSADALKTLNVQPDVKLTNASSKILYRHRKDDSRDIYWLNNRSGHATTAEVSFRISGKEPELWNPINGKIEKVSYTLKEGRTVVPLKFESWDAYFIIFKEITAVTNFSKPDLSESLITEISGPWTVDFDNLAVEFKELKSWSENADNHIKYFSGTASYKKSFKIKKFKSNKRYFIDLGDVKNMAEIIINGKGVGVAWKKPFQLEITDAVKKGKNAMEIKVTNTWVNRLIGDAQSDVVEKSTFTTMPFYRADSPLLPSGLLGKVKIIHRK